MKLIPEPMKVEAGDGFKNDRLGRAEFGAGLANLVSVLEGPATLVLDGEWGVGKTTFVEMWRGLLDQRGIANIYFNAFDNDYLDDAFLALAGEFAAQSGPPTPIRKKFVKTAVTVGKAVGKFGVRLAVRAATAGAIDAADLGDAVSGAANDLGKEGSDAVSKLIEAKITGRDTEREAMSRFRNSLEELAQNLIKATAVKAKTDNQASLIFIVDELDRCRPDFALTLLEGIKHLFSVKSVVFLIVSNLHQLEDSVRNTYGADKTARLYLEKFFQIRLTLPPPKSGRHSRGIGPFVIELFRDLPSDSGRPGAHGRVHELVEQQLAILHAKKGLSLRKLERLATQVAIVYASTGQRSARIAPLIVDLALLKLDAPDLYDKARRGTLTVPELET